MYLKLITIVPQDPNVLILISFKSVYVVTVVVPPSPWRIYLSMQMHVLKRYRGLKLIRGMKFEKYIILFSEMY